EAFRACPSRPPVARVAARGALSGAGPLRVTLVTHYYPAHLGGVERVAGQLAERLAASGIAQIEWHASDCDAPPPRAPGLSAVPATQAIVLVPYRNALLRGTHEAANRALGTSILGSADRVVFVSETVRGYFGRFVRFRHPAELVQNGVDTALFHPAAALERRE